MKTILIWLGLIGLSVVNAFSQSRVSLAPTYWFNYGNYAYQTATLHADPATKPYTVASALGLTARYHFNEMWNVSLGVLYNKNTSPVITPMMDKANLITNFVQLPTFLNFRSSTHRLAPYFSTGAVFHISTVASQPVKSSLVLGAGVDYRINAKLSWLLQPTYSYLLYNPADTTFEQFIDYEAYAFGVQTQFIWRF
ncbi:outer membrane beta-barrel protein [Spirosoma flavum]|uniref:Outer membrane beta-barrel protein n=1 Tax=Spirosoma flavum TaxID=2048557 RepID=A0ABW6AQC7_9BACT